MERIRLRSRHHILGLLRRGNPQSLQRQGHPPNNVCNESDASHIYANPSSILHVARDESLVRSEWNGASDLHAWIHTRFGLCHLSRQRQAMVTRIHNDCNSVWGCSSYPLHSAGRGSICRMGYSLHRRGLLLQEQGILYDWRGPSAR